MRLRSSGALLGLAFAGVFLSAPAAAQVPEPEVLCSLPDPRLDEVSGMAVDGDRWYVVNDGGTRLEVFVLDQQCQVQDVIRNPTDPYDVEDLALAQDGTLWLGDTGDNRRRRDTVALHALTPDGESVLYRLTYPDGAHDAEALLLDESGTPYIITKHVLGRAGVYRPAQPLSSPGPTPLERVGTVGLKATDTPGGPVGSLGSILVTGAASTPDRSVIALRTYTDAYLYPVPDGDVVAALQREPLRIPLPDEQQGEAIAFTDDGTLLSASEGVGTPVRAVAGAADLVSNATADSGGAGNSAAENSESDGHNDVDPVDSEEDQEDDSGIAVFPGIMIAVGLAGGAAFAINRLRR